MYVMEWNKIAQRPGEAATRGKWQAADASQPQRKKGLYRARAPDRRGYALGPARDRDREKAK